MSASRLSCPRTTACQSGVKMSRRFCSRLACITCLSPSCSQTPRYSHHSSGLKSGLKSVPKWYPVGGQSYMFNSLYIRTRWDYDWVGQKRNQPSHFALRGDRDHYLCSKHKEVPWYYSTPLTGQWLLTFRTTSLFLRYRGPVAPLLEA